MKITLDNFEDVIGENTSFEKFKSKKRNLSTRKNTGKVTNEYGEVSFSSSHLEGLNETGIVDELLHVIKSGKEATVYLGKGKDGFSAVKIYTELRVRSFRNDGIYRDGRFIGSQRVEKAIQQGSEFGLNAHQILWVNEEFRQMNYLYKIGIPVPKPIANSGLVIVMEFIGSDGESAPRISDIQLEKSEAEDAFRQSVKILESIVKAGRIHGDFSAYNLLWHNGKVIVIDFPQVIGIQSNPSAKELLRRDVDSFCKSFKKYKLEFNADKLFSNLLRIIHNSGIDLN